MSATKIVFVHDKRCPFSRSLYPVLTDALIAARRLGKEPVVVAIDREESPQQARQLTPTVPAIFKTDSDGKPTIKHEGRRNAESLLKFMIE